MESLRARVMFSKLIPEAVNPDENGEGVFYLRSPKETALKPGEETLIDTGLRFYIPPGIAPLLSEASPVQPYHLARPHEWVDTFGGGFKPVLRLYNDARDPLVLRKGEHLASLRFFPLITAPLVAIKNDVECN